MIAELAVTAPGLSCAPGTIERKLIDANAEAISEAYVDQYLLGSMLDVDSKVGLELEQWVGTFGYGRNQGKASEGVVRITLNIAAAQDYEIPLGSQFYTKAGVVGSSLTSGTPLYFASTSAVVLVAGSLSVDVPVRCTVVGTIGNVPPDTITYLGSAIGSGSATNLTSLTGGVDVETDTELRQRFKDTMLRNMAGTSDFYRALCLAHNRVSRAEVYGPTALYRTQIAAPSTTLTITDPDIKWTWADMHSCFANYGQSDQVFYSPIYDYGLSSGPLAPVFTRHSAGQIASGAIVDLELQYTPACSRNDPDNDITNKVDLFVDGVESVAVTETTVVSDDELTNTAGNMLYVGNFERVGTTGDPTAENWFMRLGSVPIVSFPATITFASTVYVQGVHYHLLRDTTLHAGSSIEVSGIEWVAGVGPDDGTELTLTYVCNTVPEVLAHVMSSSKQVGTDVMVHQAKFRYIRPHLSIQYDRAYAPAVVDAAIDERLKAFFSNMPFGAHVRVSSLTMAVQQVLGVVDVKLTTSGEAPSAYGVKIFHDGTDTTPESVKTTDFKLDDDSLPVYTGMVLLRKAAP